MDQDRGVVTNREKEAIYEYSLDISKTQGVQIEMLFNGGNRMLKITQGGQSTQFALKNPKKPEGTGSVLRFAGSEVFLSKELAELLPFPFLAEE
jgi:hypothetical protein